MHDALSKIKNFYYSKNDLAITLIAYNITFCLWCTFFTNDRRVSLLFAFIVLLLTLFTITLIRFLKKTNEIEVEINANDHYVRKKIEDEYKKVHMLRKRKELLMKAGCLDSEESKSVFFDVDDVGADSHNKLNSARKVHFNYLDRYGPSYLQKKKKEK